VKLDLNTLPSPADSGFGPVIRNLTRHVDEPERAFRAGLADSSATQDQRFACLYGLLTYLRRELRFEEYQTVVRDCEAEFGSEPHFEHFRVVVARWTGEDARSIRLALEKSDRAVTRVPGDPGILHQYAELVATLGDLDEGAAREYLNRALELVDRAIAMAPEHHASYYATRARLRLLEGSLEQARSDIERAMARENSRSPYYSRLISRYEAVKMRIILRRQQQVLEQRQQKVLADLDQFKSQQLSLLSLLAALIALLAVTASIATRMNPAAAVHLITACGGVIVIAFGAVTAALTGARMSRVTMVLIFGLLLLSAGFATTLP
jgi:tetratricopeptide (TPR) repeat protein